MLVKVETETQGEAVQHTNPTQQQQNIPVEIKEDQPNEKSKGYLFRPCSSKVVSLCRLRSGRNSKAGGGEDAPRLGGVGKARGRLTRSRPSYVVG